MSNSNGVLAGSQKTVALGTVLDRVGNRVQRQFAELIDDHQKTGGESRPQALLGFVHAARQQLLRSAAVLHDIRKLPPLTSLVQPGGVLDVAASHARVLQTVADELHRANQELKNFPRIRVQLFNIPCALDVLSTGTYNNLPASIHDMRGPRALPEAQQQRLINQLNHLLYSQLLKAHLPACLELIKVTGGYAVLRCKGLYEVQLSLFQQPYPPQVAEAREEAAAAAAKQAQEQQQAADGQTGQQQQEPGQQAGQTAAGSSAADQPGSNTSDTSSQPSGQSAPELRWQWTLTHAVLLPNAASHPPLQPVQLEQLLRALRERMWYAADAAAVEAVKRAGQQQKQKAEDGTAASQEQQQQSSVAQPSSSGLSTGLSTASGVSSVSAAAESNAGRGLQLEKYAADEVTVPLRVMHGVLRDVAAQVLLHEVRLAAEKLAGPGSKWEGQLRLSKAEVLSPGIRMHYWQQVPVLLAAQPAGAGSTAGAAEAAPSLPAVELGLGSDGTVQTMHLPPLRLAGSLQQVPLVLDAHTVDVEGLLLQAVAVTASTQLHVLKKAVGQLLRQRGLQQFVQLQLCSFGETAEAAAAAVRDSDDGGDAAAPAAIAGAGAGSSADAGGGTAPAVAVGMPDSLVLVMHGNALVCVSFQPWSGRVVLRPGNAYGGVCNMEMGILLHQHQDALQHKQESAKQLQSRRSLQDQQVVLAALQEIAAGLTELCGELWMKMQLSNFLAAARTMALHHTHHHFKGLPQAPQLLHLPSAAAAMGGSSRRDAALAAGAAAAVGIAGVSTIRSSSQHTMYLAMPNLQLPPYMLLLAAGGWCGSGTPSSSSRQQAAAAVAAPAGMPSGIAALGPTLCMSFPRRRVLAEARDCLLLVLCDAQGLAGPVLKRVRLPVSCYASTTAATAAGLAAGGGAAAAGASADDAAAAAAQRKRKRHEQDDPQQQPEQQQQQQDQQGAAQQEQQLPAGQRQRPRGWLLQAEEHAAELGSAVKWCQAQLTFERLLLEMKALQLEIKIGQPTSSQQQQPQPPEQQWQQPAIQLLGVPGVQLFQVLQRKQGCVPGQLGLQEVLFITGPQYGQWRMQLRGRFYHQLPHSMAGPPAAAGGGGGSVGSQQQQNGANDSGSSGSSGSYGSLPGQGWDVRQLSCFEYDLRAGDSVRCAVLQLIRLVRMQQFLNKLESMAWGDQQLQVVDVDQSLWPGLGLELGPAGQGSGSSDASLAGLGTDGLLPPAKKARQQLQQHGNGNGVMCNSAAAAASGAPTMNGLAQPDQQQRTSNGQPISNGICTAAGTTDHQQQQQSTYDGAGSAAHANSNSSSSCSYGLLFHWQGTGLVRLASYSCCAAVLECGSPLQLAAAVAPAGLLQQLQQHTPQRLQYMLQWQPCFEFTTHAGSSSSSNEGASGSSGNFSNTSSSSTTTWVDVRPKSSSSEAAGRGSNDSSSAAAIDAAQRWPPGKAVKPIDVLATACSVTCSAPCVPVDVLNELSDMVSSGCEELLLDALGVVSWPLAAVAATLSSSPTAAGAGAGVLRPDRFAAAAVSCCMMSAFRHVRYKVDLVQPATAAAVGTGSSTAAAAGAPAAAATGGLTGSAGALGLEMLFACHGRVGIVLQYSSNTAGHADQQQQQQPAAAGLPTVTVDVPAAIDGFMKHMARQHSVPLLPVISGEANQGSRLVRQGQHAQQAAGAAATIAKSHLVGFWLLNQHLSLVLQELLVYWRQLVAAQTSRAMASAAAAAVTGAGTVVGGGVALKQEPIGQQQQAPQQQQVVVVGQQLPQQQQVAAGQQQQAPQQQHMMPQQQQMVHQQMPQQTHMLGGATVQHPQQFMQQPQQQFQQQPQQQQMQQPGQQQMVPSSHMSQQVQQHTAAGPVATGL